MKNWIKIGQPKKETITILHSNNKLAFRISTFLLAVLKVLKKIIHSKVIKTTQQENSPFKMVDLPDKNQTSPLFITKTTLEGKYNRLWTKSRLMIGLTI